MTVYKQKIEVQSTGERPTFVDLTSEVRETIENSGVSNGIVTVVTPHTTCAIFYEEFAHDLNEFGQDTLQVELDRVLQKIIPNHDSEDTYIYPGPEHFNEVMSWPNADNYLPNKDISDLWNGDAHLKATIIGASESFEVDKGKLAVGKTGYIYFVDFDRARPRKRSCSIIVIGE
ncbi:YjbQ family protein [Hutsoniella sourekii]|uniref:YjbQ family protein n=1 Tax=Hutsoniella sourekii TaxID=87650 RepID=UPI00048800C8|nr:YjbQ family protein [Hutsoniella sourekii]